MTDLNTAKINSLTQNVQQLRVRLDGIKTEMDSFGSLICKIEGRLAALEDAENYRQQDEDVERACESGMLETLTERVAGSIRDVNIHGGTWEEQARASASMASSPKQPDLSSLNHEGVVTRVLPDGYAYVDERGPNRRRYIVSFSRSVPNYRGETARDLRLSRGTQVRFSRNGNEIQRIAVGPNYEEFLRSR